MRFIEFVEMPYGVRLKLDKLKMARMMQRDKHRLLCLFVAGACTLRGDVCRVIQNDDCWLIIDVQTETLNLIYEIPEIIDDLMGAIVL